MGIKKCGKHDMPASLVKQYEVKVDHTGDEEDIDEDVDDTPSNPNFNFSTSVRLEDEALKRNGGNEEVSGTEEEADDATKTQKKGKFTVTTVSNNGKKGKFTVTTVNDEMTATSNDNNSNEQAVKDSQKKTKSRFQVTQVDD